MKFLINGRTCVCARIFHAHNTIRCQMPLKMVQNGTLL